MNQVVVVVGDQGVGKSTLLLSILRSSYTIPLTESTLPDLILNHNILIDTTAKPSTATLNRATVILLLFDPADPTSTNRITQHWLPTLRAHGLNVPVILVATKHDLHPHIAIHQLATSIMIKFKEVESAIKTSSKLNYNLEQVLHLAINAVKNPTAPLYDSKTHALKLVAQKALGRIFGWVDRNRDGVLDQAELDQFQRLCFGTPLEPHEMEGLIGLIESAPELEGRGVRQGGVTKEGFLWLQTWFIQHGRLETTWTVLRSFGFGQDLTLRDDFLQPPFPIPVDSTVELSPQGYQFFTNLFKSFDLDQDGVLGEEELEKLFEGTPRELGAGRGWMESTVTTDVQGREGITLQGFLAQWSLVPFLPPAIVSN